MRRELKVYGWTDFAHQDGFRRQVRAIVAARSLAAASRAAEAAGLQKISRDYCSTSGNENDLATALPHEGVVFVRPLDDWGGEYVRLAPEDRKSPA